MNIMDSVFFYREGKGLFVVTSLAIWFAVLGLLGPYLPANAVVTHKEMVARINGHKAVGHWIKKNGLWKFQKISRIIQTGSRETAFRNANDHLPSRRAMASSVAKAPATTASIGKRRLKKINKRVLRARLADEIGRWAKIGTRWEWRKKGLKARRRPTLEEDRGPKARWGRRNGVWVFEAVNVSRSFRNI
jgi:hypothetical protein